MMTPAFTDFDLLSDFAELEENMIDNVIHTMRYAGEHFIKTARTDGAYKDDTGNLRSSIFYILLHDGKVVSNDMVTGRSGNAQKENQELLQELPSEYPDGIVLICGAGMKYAAAVEGLHHKDVITGSTIKLEKDLKKSLQEAIKNV
jgi:hypothetical protein